MPPAEGGTVIRRRPTRRHRRNRRIRQILLLTVVGALALGVTSVALKDLSPTLFRAARNDDVQRQADEASRNALLAVQQESLRQMSDRPVYPYSVVPGGVRDVAELKWAAAHDPVVRAHYAGFDYDNARVVRLVLARTAYVSYRIGNRIYWTRHRVKLKKGEAVITDGKIIARTRCANRVEEVPQQAAQETAPPAVNFDQPMLPATGTPMAVPPVAYQSTLLNPPVVPASAPLGTYYPLGGGTLIPIAPPRLPGVCVVIPPKKPGSGPEAEKVTNVAADKKKKIGNPCENGPGSGGEVPEPGTWMLVASGLGLLAWRVLARHRTYRFLPWEIPPSA